MPPCRRLPALLAALLAGCSAGQAPPAPRPAAATGAATPRAGVSPPRRGEADAKVARGLRALSAGDVPAASRAFEQALTDDPADRQALSRLARITQAQAMELPRPQSSPLYLRSAGYARRLRAAHPDLDAEDRALLPTILYNEACTLALDGQGDRAVGSLAEAAEAGFDSLETVEGDDELVSLHHRDDYRDLVRRLERRRALALMAATDPAPFDFRLNDPDGKALALSGFRGKVVVVHVWGTWCPPCRKEVPHLVALYQRDHGKGLEVVGLNYEIDDGDAARRAVRAAVKEFAIPYPCVVGDEPTRGAIPGFSGFPTTLFLDGRGRVRLALPGYQPFSALDAAASALLDEAKAGQARDEKRPLSRKNGASTP